MTGEKFTRLQWMRSIKFRLLLFGTVMSLVPLLVLGGYNLYAAQKNLREAVSYHHALGTSRVAGDVAAMLGEAQRSLAILADVAGNRFAELNESERRRLLSTCLSNLPYIEQLAAYDDQGRAMGWESRQDVTTGVHLADFVNEDAKVKLEHHQVYIGPVTIDEHNQPVFQLAVPFLPTSAGQPTGELVATVSLRGIMERITSVSAGRGGYIFLVEQNGRLIGHEDFSQVLSGQDVKASLLPAKPGGGAENFPLVRTYVSYTGEKVVGAYARVVGTDWAVILEQPIQYAYASSQVLAGTFALSTIITAGLLLVVTWIFGLRFVSQLNTLKEGVGRIASGEVGFTLPVMSKDEIGELTYSFNSLSEELYRKRNIEGAMRQADKMVTVGLLAAGVAHEINNPLATISLSVEELLEQFRPGQEIAAASAEICQRYLLTISQQVSRCTQITRTLLDFSRQGRETSPSDFYNLNQTVHKALVLLDFRIRKQDINVRTDWEPNPPLLWGDASAMLQISFNLICNSLDAMPAGGDLTLISRYENDYLFLTITDSGSGIAEEDLPRIFEPFFTTKPPGQGTGLGLSVCYGLVNRAGGHIDVTSKEGRGTTVQVRLPVKGKVSGK